jgi:hypothetical protein
LLAPRAPGGEDCCHGGAHFDGGDLPSRDGAEAQKTAEPGSADAKLRKRLDALLATVVDSLARMPPDSGCNNQV